MNRADATERYESLLRLTPAQAIAIDVLDRGGTHLEAAEAAGTHRVTVTRWVHHHPAFVAELNRRRFERLELISKRCHQVTLRAMDLVEAEIEEGGLSAALNWLRIAPVFVRASAQPPNRIDRSMTASGIIDQATESAAMSETLEMLNRAYVGTAVDRIHAAIGPD